MRKFVDSSFVGTKEFKFKISRVRFEGKGELVDVPVEEVIIVDLP